MRRFPIAVLAAFHCCWAVAGPMSGQPDPAFGVAGITVTPFDLGGFNTDTGRLLVSDPSGRLILVGQVALSYGADSCLGIARFLADGTNDASFGIDGRICHDLLPGGIELNAFDAVALQGGGLLLAGLHDYSLKPTVCRFDAQGEPDVSFGGGCVQLHSIDTLNSVPNGGLDVIGSVSIAVAKDRIHVAAQTVHQGQTVKSVRFSTLTLDGDVIPIGQQESVGIVPDDDQSSDYWLSEMLLDAQGRLIVAGAFASAATLGNDFYIARLDADTYTLDATFNGSGIRSIAFDRGGDSGNNDVPATVALLPEGRMVVAGSADTPGGKRPAFATLDQSGQLASTANGGKPVVYDPCVFFFGKCRMSVSGASALSHRRVLLAGEAMHDGFRRIFTLRLNASGVPDAFYGQNFPGQSGVAFVQTTLPQRSRGLVMQGDRPVVGGWQDMLGPGGTDFLVSRLQP